MLHRHTPLTGDSDDLLAPMFSRRQMREPIPRWEIPEGEMPPGAASQLIRDELQLDGTPVLNLASFVTTWMEPEADSLFELTASKNFIDAEEYPRTAEIEHRCVNMIANLFGAGAAPGEAVGTSTVGSSEAILLAGMALKRTWQHRRTAAGLPTDSPNIVLGRHVHVCWEKLCRYFEIEPRWVPVSAGNIGLDIDAAVALVDENTIGVAAVMGNTFTGAFDDVAGLSAALDALAERTGLEDIRGLVSLLAQSIRFGTSVADTLRIYADEFRDRRTQAAEEMGAKIGTKLIFPLIFCLWPSFFLVAIGPAMIGVFRAFGNM